MAFTRTLVVGDSFSNDSNDWPGQPMNLDTEVEATGGHKLTDDIEPAFAANLLAHSTVDSVIIQGGINDIIASKSLAQMQTAVNSLISQSEAAGKSVAVVGVAPFKNHTSWDSTKQALLESYNTWLGTLPQSTVQIYGLLESSSDADELDASYDVGDGLHPNTTGSIAIARHVSTALAYHYFLETFTGSIDGGYDNSGWAEVGVVDPNSPSSAIGTPPSWGTSCFSFHGVEGTDNYLRHASLQSKKNVYARIEVAVRSDVGLGGDKLELLTLYDASYDRALLIFYIPSTKGLYCRVEDTSSGAQTITLLLGINYDQRYRLEAHLDLEGLTWELWMNGKDVDSGTLVSPVIEISRMQVGGQFTSGSGHGTDVLLSMIGLDTLDRLWNEPMPLGDPRQSGVHEVIHVYGDDANYTVDYDEGEFSLWEATLSGHVVSHVLEVRADKVSYEDNLFLNGPTGDSEKHVIVRAMHGHAHNGTFDGSGPIFTLPPAKSRVFELYPPYAEVQDIVIKVDITSSSTLYGAMLRGKGQKLVNVLVDGVRNAGSGGGYGVWFSATGGAGEEFIVVNSIIRDCDNYGIRTGSDTIEYAFYNVTVMDSGLEGVKTASAGVVTCKNCLVNGSGNFDYRGTFHADSTFNRSSDGTEPGVSGGTFTATFIDAPGGDYHLTQEDAESLAGVSLEADPVFSFNRDIDGQLITAWSIGADSRAASFQGGWQGQSMNLHIGVGL